MEYLFDEENGVILDKVTKDRCLILTKARMSQLFTRITANFQTGAPVIIREICKTAGERFITEVPEGKNANPVLFLNTVVQRFTNAGLGKIELVSFNPDTLELKFRIHNNFFAEISSEDSTCCCVVEAFVEGLFKGLMGEKPKIEETKCIGKNDPYCEWRITR